MRNREKVAEGQCIRLSSALLNSGNRDFLVAKAEINHQAEDVGLETEPARIWMPAHHIVTQVHRQTIVVVQPVAGHKVHQPVYVFEISRRMRLLPSLDA